MTILLLTLGSHGDIHPFLSLAQALAARGHRAVLATNPYFEEQIVRGGIECVALTERLDLKSVITEHPVMDGMRGPLVVLRKLILPNVSTIVERTRELLCELSPSVVVFHPIVLGVPIACELEGGIPTVSISLSPTLWNTPGDPIVLFPGRTTAPAPWLGALQRGVSRWVLRAALDPGLNRVRRALGLPKERDQLQRAAGNATLNLGLWSPIFRPPLPGDPDPSAVTGFTWHDRDHTQEVSDHELASFLHEGSPPIVFALGSTGVHAAGSFYSHAVEATQELGARALLVIGRDQAPPSRFPSNGNIKAVAYAPYSAAFAAAAVSVHHGGVGTTAQGLRSGRPTLVTPMAHDQFDNAARVKRLGTGDAVPFTKVTARRLCQALDGLLRDDRYAARAAAIATQVRTEDGAVFAAKLIIDRFGG